MRDDQPRQKLFQKMDENATKSPEKEVPISGGEDVADVKEVSEQVGIGSCEWFCGKKKSSGVCMCVW